PYSDRGLPLSGEVRPFSKQALFMLIICESLERLLKIILELFSLLYGFPASQ
ncbi:hypothetical protein LCGC14_2368520, partial [marine sediment metagenome]